MMSSGIGSLPELEHFFGLGKSLAMDCSEAVTLVFRLAGCGDPNGLGFNGYGYTGTMLSHLPHYTALGAAHPGALLVFGSGTGTHVCMVMEPSAGDPVLFSHGSEIGPLRIRLSAERLAHIGEPITLLDIGQLLPRA